MGPRDQRADSWSLGPDEAVVACLNPLISGMEGSRVASETCHSCKQDPYRIVVIESPQRGERRIAICRQHFLRVCKDCNFRNACLLSARLHVLLTEEDPSAHRE